MALQLVSTIREFREFLAAKRRRREPLVLTGKGVAMAPYVPRSFAAFERFRESLRGVGHWGHASERLDALEHALRKRTGAALPLPRKAVQNEDRSLTIYWTGVTVRCFPDGFVSNIGGSGGVVAKKITPELLDTLAFASRIERAS